MIYKITLNGRTYEVEVEAGQAMLKAEYDAIAPAPSAAPTAAPAAAPAAAASDSSVNAPIPGTILKVNVTVGQSVQAEDVLCILEAMKMENEIKAPRAGKVTQILVSKGVNVVSGSPLVVIE